MGQMRPTRRVKPVRSTAAVATVALLAGVLAPWSPAAAEAEPWSIPPMQVAAVPPAQAGEVVVWGDDERGQLTVPASLQGVAVSQVVTSTGAVLALTAAGRVVGWGGNAARIQEVPVEVNTIGAAQIAAAPNDSYAGAVLKNGTVKTWGIKSAGANPLTVPSDAVGVTQLALTGGNAVVLKADHTVQAWGKEAPVNAVPGGLHATAIAAANGTALALTTEGTVVAWGSNSDHLLDLPAELKEPGAVTAIAWSGDGALAVLRDGSLIGWGAAYRTASDSPWAGALVPPSMTGHQVMALNGAAGSLLALDEEGVLHDWSSGVNPVDLGRVPGVLTGRPITQFVGNAGYNSAAVVTKLLTVTSPSVSGAVRAGSTVTATPGAFSASPTSITSQWYVNGVATGNSAPTLSLTAAMVGKTIAYVSTASKAGETTVTSSSTPVTVAAAPKPPAPVKVGSATKVSSVKAAKKGAKVTLAGKVTASKAPAGKAVVTIKKGNKKIVAKTVKVPANGVVKLRVAKFNKVALKALKKALPPKKRKKLKKTAYRGKYTVTVAYGGNAQVKPSSAKASFKVK